MTSVKNFRGIVRLSVTASMTASVVAVFGSGCNDPLKGYFAKAPGAKSSVSTASVPESLPDPSAGPAASPSSSPVGGVSPTPAPAPATVESFALAATVSHTVERYKGVDLLWVIDNSGSMDPYQARIAAGFKTFAQTYFVAGRDIRLATITSDVFLAGNVDSVAEYGPLKSICYSRLLPGIHDGLRPPVASLNDDCSLKGALPADRTGQPILSTYNASGALGDLSQLIKDFQVNAKPGIKGDGDERVMQSASKMIKDNEERPECANGTGADCLFRKNRVRGLIFISDEHSHDVISVGTQSADAVNKTLAPMTDDQVKVNAAKLAGLYKSRFNSFFSGLDGKADPNYFVASIANHTCVGGNCGLNSKTNTRNADEPWSPELTAIYQAVNDDTTNSAGKLSIKAEITDADYTRILAQLGTSIDTQTEQVVVSTFALKQPPSGSSPLKAFLVLMDGTRTQLPLSAIRVNGKSVDIDRSALPVTPPAGAQVEISYYP